MIITIITIIIIAFKHHEFIHYIQMSQMKLYNSLIKITIIITIIIKTIIIIIIVKLHNVINSTWIWIYIILSR